MTRNRRPESPTEWCLPRLWPSATLWIPARQVPKAASGYPEPIRSVGFACGMTPRGIGVITSGFCRDGSEQPIDRMSEHNRATGDPEDPESAAPATDVETTADSTSAPAERDDGPVRRPLIRATLKHPEGTPPPPRQPPVFTMHQNQPGSQARGQNRNGRQVRSSGHPNSQKSSRERSGQNTSSRGNGGGNKGSARQDRGQRSGNRSSSRRNKGRSR